MAWTDAEERRVVNIEDALVSVTNAIGNLVSKMQLRQLLILKQAELDELTKQVTDLETKLTTLEGRM